MIGKHYKGMLLGTLAAVLVSGGILSQLPVMHTPVVTQQVSGPVGVLRSERFELVDSRASAEPC
jgi:hypothetical protein